VRTRHRPTRSSAPQVTASRIPHPAGQDAGVPRDALVRQDDLPPARGHRPQRGGEQGEPEQQWRQDEGDQHDVQAGQAQQHADGGDQEAPDERRDRAVGPGPVPRAR
jgi:hypothetical protein